MPKLKDLGSRVSQIETAVEKVGKEVTGALAELDALKKALDDVEIPADAASALERVEAKLKSIDDAIPDAPETPPAQG